MCETLYECFFYTLDRGIRSGGGVGDHLATPSIIDDERQYFVRLVFDIAFFAIVTVVLVKGGA